MGVLFSDGRGDTERRKRSHKKHPDDATSRSSSSSAYRSSSRSKLPDTNRTGLSSAAHSSVSRASSSASNFGPAGNANQFGTPAKHHWQAQQPGVVMTPSPPNNFSGVSGATGTSSSSSPPQTKPGFFGSFMEDLKTTKPTTMVSTMLFGPEKEEYVVPKPTAEEKFKQRFLRTDANAKNPNSTEDTSKFSRKKKKGDTSSTSIEVREQVDRGGGGTGAPGAGRRRNSLSTEQWSSKPEAEDTWLSGLDGLSKQANALVTQGAFARGKKASSKDTAARNALRAKGIGGNGGLDHDNAGVSEDESSDDGSWGKRAPGAAGGATSSSHKKKRSGDTHSTAQELDHHSSSSSTRRRGSSSLLQTHQEPKQSESESWMLNSMNQGITGADEDEPLLGALRNPNAGAQYSSPTTGGGPRRAASAKKKNWRFNDSDDALTPPETPRADEKPARGPGADFFDLLGLLSHPEGAKEGAKEAKKLKTSGGKNAEKLQQLRGVVESDSETLVCELAPAGGSKGAASDQHSHFGTFGHHQAHAKAAAALAAKKKARRFRLPNGVTLTFSELVCFFATLTGMVLFLIYLICCCVFGFSAPTNVVVELTCFVLDAALHGVSNCLGFITYHTHIAPDFNLAQRVHVVLGSFWAAVTTAMPSLKSLPVQGMATIWDPEELSSHPLYSRSKGGIVDAQRMEGGAGGAGAGGEMTAAAAAAVETGAGGTSSLSGDHSKGEAENASGAGDATASSPGSVLAEGEALGDSGVRLKLGSSGGVVEGPVVNSVVEGRVDHGPTESAMKSSGTKTTGFAEMDADAAGVGAGEDAAVEEDLPPSSPHPSAEGKKVSGSFRGRGDHQDEDTDVFDRRSHHPSRHSEVDTAAVHDMLLTTSSTVPAGTSLAQQNRKIDAAAPSASGRDKSTAHAAHQPTSTAHAPPSSTAAEHDEGGMWAGIRESIEKRLLQPLAQSLHVHPRPQQRVVEPEMPSSFLDAGEEHAEEPPQERDRESGGGSLPSVTIIPRPWGTETELHRGGRRSAARGDEESEISNEIRTGQPP